MKGHFLTPCLILSVSYLPVFQIHIAVLVVWGTMRRTTQANAFPQPPAVGSRKGLCLLGCLAEAQSTALVLCNFALWFTGESVLLRSTSWAQ